MNYPKTILWSGVIAAFCFTGAAYAQTSAAKDVAQTNQTDVAQQEVAPSFDNLLAFNDAAAQQNSQDQNVQELGTINATGLAFSMKQSLATEKLSSGIVSAITATDIGQLPATNVAEALRHLPGVTIDNTFPIQQRVTIGGISPALNLTLLNGHGIAQTRWFYANSPNRGFNFSMMPTDIIGSIEIHKSSQASLPAGGLGGTIVVHTLNPLDVKANTFSGSIGFLYNAQSKNTDPNATLIYSTHNQAGSFGFSVALSHFENDYVRQGREEFNAPYPNLGAEAAVAGPGTWLYKAVNVTHTVDPAWQIPAEVNRAYFKQDEKRNSAYVSVAWKPTASFSSQLHLLYTATDAQNYNSSMYPVNVWVPQLIDAITPPTASMGNVTQGGHITSVACTLAERNAAKPGCATIRTVQDDYLMRTSKIKTESVGLHLAYDGAGWGVSGRVGFNSSNNDNNGQYALAAQYYGGWTWDTYKGFKFDDNAKATDPAYWNTIGNASYTRVPTKQRKNFVQADFHVDFDGVINKVEFGVLYNNTYVSQNRFSYNGTQTHRSLAVANIPTTIVDMTSWDDALSSWKHSLTVTDAAAVKAGVLSAVAAPGQKSVSELLAANNWSAASARAADWGVHQTKTQAYIQADFTNYNNLRGNFGLRFAKVDNDMSNPTQVSAGVWKWKTTSGSSNVILPSANIAYTPTANVVLRAAIAKTVAYNGFGNLNNSVFLNDTFLTGSAGNTQIEPYQSVNTRLSAAWYFNPTSRLSVDLFNRNIINYVHTGTDIQLHQNVSWNTLLHSSPALAGCTSSGLCPYKVTAPINGGAGRAVGFTVAYLQSFGDTGFGLGASYTMVDAHNSEGGALPYNSMDTYKIRPFYSKGPINASITYSNRSKYQANGYIAGAAVTELADYEYMSASFSYAFTKHWALQLTGTNLLNTQQRSYYSSDPNQAANNYYLGRVWQVKVHFKF